MVFLNIDPKNYNVPSKKLHDKSPIQILNEAIQNGKHVFILIYMVGCHPCEATISEWKKIQNVLENNHSKIHNFNNTVIADMDKNVFEKMKHNDKEQKQFKKVFELNSLLSGFPTIKYISTKNKNHDYEDANIKVKDRTIDSFVDWITTTMNSSNTSHTVTHKAAKPKQRGGFVYSKNKNTLRNSKSLKTTSKLTGGKWSRKYKKSINCKRPKGFSQKQYCKYSRK